ncbi:hypothetical protein UlMin_042773 [Ulmus minor]
MAKAIVLYPTPPIGHLISMVELGKHILNSRPSLSVHILITTPPYNPVDTAPYISGVAATNSSITFHRLPTISLPPEFVNSTTHHEDLTFEVLRLQKPNVLQALRSISQSFTIHAFIMDFFCATAVTVSDQLNIPGYIFYTSGAATLGSFLYLPTLHRNTSKSLKDLNTLLNLPGSPPIPSSDMPKPVLNREEMAYKCFLDCSIHFLKSSGFIVNTFGALEPRALKAISDGLCVPETRTPPVFPVGPLIVSQEKKGASAAGDTPECLKWLDSQPKGSVIFLCFGSLGLFGLEQLREIAVGLERSGRRFLWVVRNPPAPENQNLATSAKEDPDLDSLLPEGFLERTKERGLVVKRWAPQVAVLNHESVGGFVTHCGWNSVLEAVCAGVPMVALPLYAGQRFNRVVLVEEIKNALPMNESEHGFVSWEEVEKRVTELMDSERGNSVRERALTLKNEAKVALGDGGSSRVALTKLTESWNLG